MSHSVSSMTRSQGTTGVILALGAYGWWGVVIPIYYHQLQDVAVLELVAWRVLSGLPVLLAMILLASRFRAMLGLLAKPRVMTLLLSSAVLIAVNWLVFIHAVDDNRLTEASLGYYISPLLSVTIGMVVFGERMRGLQWMAISIAAIGVIVMAFQIGGLPWISLILGGCFALYGFIHKQVAADAVMGLSIEMLMLFPVMILLLGMVHAEEGAMIAGADGWMIMMLLLGGPITVIQLLLFTGAVRRLHLSTVGILQYLAPTGQLLTAVLLLGEPLDAERLSAFCLIWTAVIIYSWDTWRQARANMPVTIPE
ncbi:MAG: EamA family transporter RarD [Phycisphaerales bacterium]|nr:EamA family transporter RarD [Phycisphaerales bacterium]